MNSILSKPRFHGNGFIQVYLNSVTRLHIWSPKFPPTRIKDSQIHDHRFSFISKVLLGELHHTTYDIDYDEIEGAHSVYQAGVSTIVSKPQFLSYCNLLKPNETIYTQGDEYIFGGPGNFHKTGSTKLTVTILTKVKTVEGYRARIIAIDKHKPDHAFENQPNLNLLREECIRAMALIF